MTAAKIYRRVKEYLDKNGIRYTEVKGKKEIRISMPLRGMLQSTDIRIVCSDFNVSILAYIEKADIEPRFDEKSCASVLEYLARVNYNLVNGTFDANLDNGEVRFKQSINCMEEPSLSDDLLGINIAMPQVMYNYYGDGLLAVMYGEKSPKEAIDEIRGSEDDSCSCGCDH